GSTQNNWGILTGFQCVLKISHEVFDVFKAYGNAQEVSRSKCIGPFDGRPMLDQAFHAAQAGSLRKNTGSIGKLARPSLITFYLKGKHPPVAGIVYGFHLRMR